MMIEAVIFDMDGVIIDSEPFWKEAEMHVYPSVGIQLTLEMSLRTTGLGIKDAVEYWYNKHPWTNKSIQQVQDEIVNYVLHCMLTKGKPMYGLDYVLNFFERKGLKIAIASASSIKIIETVLEKLQVKNRFHLYHSSDTEIASKPHPAVYLSTARRLGVKPEQCLVIEDSVNGMKSGKAAGMKVIAKPDLLMKSNAAYQMALRVAPAKR